MITPSTHELNCIDKLEELSAFLNAAHELSEYFIDEEIKIHGKPIKRSSSIIFDSKFLSKSLSSNGVGLQNAVSTFKKVIEPGLIRNYSSRFYNWVVGGRTPASVIGDFYATLHDQIVMLSGHGIADQVEKQTIQWLLELFKLPKDELTGILTSGATESNLCALAVARQWHGNINGVDIASAGL